MSGTWPLSAPSLRFMTGRAKPSNSVKLPIWGRGQAGSVDTAISKICISFNTSPFNKFSLDIGMDETPDIW